MRLPRTLSLYLARETLSYVAVGYLAIAAIFLAKVEPRSLLKADQATLCGQCHVQG